MFTNETIIGLLSNWTRWSEQTSRKSEAGRSTSKLKGTLDMVAGVYVNKTKSKYFGLENFIVMAVISLSSSHYAGTAMVKNWLCFTSHYGYSPLLYFLDDFSSHDMTTNEHRNKIKALIEDHQLYNKNAWFLPFPEHIFWNALTKKTIWDGTVGGKGVVDFRGDRPTFKHFGPFLKLIPLLEVTELGYTAIFFDADIALIKDPIPFIAKGTSSVVVSFETRGCDSFVTSTVFRKEKYVWRRFEPNTGILLVRPQRNGLKILRHLIFLLVNGNRANDQPFLSLPEIEYDISDDCHQNYDESNSFINIAPSGRHHAKNLKTSVLRLEENTIIGNTTRPSLCYLQDILFQNGQMAFQCARFQEYHLRMNRYAHVGSATAENTTEFVVLNSTTSFGIRMPIGDRKVENFIAPLTLHANYCNQKSVALKERGLWLLAQATGRKPHEVPKGSGVCRSYDPLQTIYGTRQWQTELTRAELRLNEIILKYKTGTILQFHRYKRIYAVENGTVRPFPNWETFVKLGLDVTDIVMPSVQWSQMLHDFFPIGKSLPDLKDVTESPLHVTRDKDGKDNFPLLYEQYKILEKSKILRTI